VFVDECQDINGAQDAILRALSREGAEANRFLVGDAKQSIYRFRLADPRIFQNYEQRWGRVGADGRFLRLTENFRSREALLRFINSVFGALMRPAVGGNPGADAELEFGDRANRIALSLDAKTTEATRRADDRTDPGEVAPCVELHLIAREASTDAGNESESDEVVSDDLPDLPATELEARLIALRLRQLKESGHRIWNLDRQCFEPVEYRDMVVLMRSTAGRAEAFAKMFHQAGVPLEAERAGFFDALEVTDLLNLLRLLDNPWQDVPLLAVLRSPLVGLSPDELVRVRLSERREPFWFALQRFLRAGRPAEPGIAATWQKTDWFVQRLAAWRELLRHSSLSDCLENALTETHYEVLLAGERGPARVANVRRLVDLARRFDPYQRQGLFRFLRFVAQQEDAEVRHEPMPLAVGNAVRLITIHRSKGLEFPVVVVAGLGSPFNFRELSEDILLQEDLGLCPKVLPPGGRRRYPSVAHWLAGQRERRARLGEEMRLLYVALTRAKDTIILVGAASKKGAAEPWREPVPVTDLALVRAGCYLDWMRLWLSQATRPVDWLNDREGANGLLRWKIHDAAIPALALPEAEAGRETDDAIVLPFESDRIAITERLSWRYPFEPATKEPGKTSASALRRRLRDETDEEAGILFPQSGARTGSRFRATSGKLSAADIGTANHVFLQMVTLERTGSRNELEGEAERLRRAGVLTDDEVGALNFGGLLAFWQSEPGRRIRAQSAQNVHRELPFTARMSPADFVALKLPVNGGLADEEFVVVQGVIDLAVIRPEEIWLVEFKTDDASHRELPEKVKLYESQVKLYALALTRIYRRRIAESWLHFLSLDDTVRI
jgi:ATP-dependent helicase/nuclease subunit A